MNGEFAGIFVGPMGQRIGWALVHFLWQGAVVAAGLGVVLQFLQRRSAQARYVAACLALAVMVLLPVVTATLISPVVETPPIARAIPQVMVSGAPAALHMAHDGVGVVDGLRPEGASAAIPDADPVRVSWRERMQANVAALLPWAVVAWVLGVAGMSLWQMTGWLLVQRIRRLGTPLAQAGVAEIFERLRVRMAVTASVRLLESALVKTPVVIGWLRPVILVPASILSGLSPGQLEAILAHELAHIRRWDCLVRILQAAVETVLFFHPAVWWVSARITQESENCCDEWALKLCTDRHQYAQALAIVAGAWSPQTTLTPAATGGKLLPRIRRILGISAKHSSGRTLLSATLALSVVLAVIVVPLACSSAELSKAGMTTTTPDVPPWIEKIAVAEKKLGNIEVIGQIRFEKRDEAKKAWAYVGETQTHAWYAGGATGKARMDLKRVMPTSEPGRLVDEESTAAFNGRTGQSLILRQGPHGGKQDEIGRGTTFDEPPDGLYTSDSESGWSASLYGLSGHRTSFGETLNILRSREGTTVRMQPQNVGGRPCVTIDLESSEQTDHYILDPSRGYALLRHETLEGGKVTQSTEVKELIDCGGGVYYPKTAVSRVGSTRALFECATATANNPQFTDSVFTIQPPEGKRFKLIPHPPEPRGMKETIVVEDAAVKPATHPAIAPTEEQTNSARLQLQTIRAEIELYRIQHQDKPPTFAGMHNNWSAMTARTDLDGTVKDTGRGPYSSAPVENPIMRRTFVVPRGEAWSRAGWTYDEKSGQIRFIVPQNFDATGLSPDDFEKIDPAKDQEVTQREANADAAHSQLFSLMNSTTVYWLGHQKQFPTVSQLQNDWAVFLKKTDKTGAISDQGELGPYLKAPPTNPFTGKTKLAPHIHPTPDAGWTYDESSQQFRLAAPPGMNLGKLHEDEVDRISPATHPATSPAVEWGPANAGIQARLFADKTLWPADQTPSFRADIRNAGTAHRTIVQSQMLCELDLDGNTYRWAGDIDVKSSDFPSGKEYDNIPIKLEESWHLIKPRVNGISQGFASDAPLKLAPGPHTLRVRFFPAAVGGGPINLAIESNTVSFEMSPPPAPAAQPATAAAETESSALQGHIVVADGPDKAVAGALVVGVPTGTGESAQRATSDAAGNFQMRRPLSDMQLHAASADHKLAALVQVKAGDDTVTVRLAPTASVHGRLLDNDGKPWPRQNVMFGIMTQAKAQPAAPGRPQMRTFTNNFGGRVTTADDGTFSAEGLIPGHEYSFTLIVPRGRARQIRTLARITPDSAKPVDVGDVSVAQTVVRPAPPADDATPPATAPALPPAEALALIEKLGATVKRQGGAADGPVVEIDFTGQNKKAVTDAVLDQLKGFDRLEKLSIDGTSVTNHGLGSLQGLKQLRVLTLAGTKVSDAGLAQLAGLTQLEALNLNATRITDKGLARLQGLTQLKRLYVDQTDVSDAGLVHLAGMKQLERLDLVLTGVTDAGLERLKGLTQLDHLNVGGTEVTAQGVKKLQEALPKCRISGPASEENQGPAEKPAPPAAGEPPPRLETQMQAVDQIRTAGKGSVTWTNGAPEGPFVSSFDAKGSGTDASLAPLKELKQLHDLNLDSTKLTDAGLACLEGLRELRNLRLEYTGVTDAGLKHLHGLDQLQTLYLDFTGVSDAGLEQLKGLGELRTLSLESTKVTDAGLAHLAGLTELRDLNLDDTRISDAGLEHLKGLKNLGLLYLNHTKVTDAGVKMIQQVLPNCTVERSNIKDDRPPDVAPATRPAATRASGKGPGVIDAFCIAGDVARPGMDNVSQ